MSYVEIGCTSRLFDIPELGLLGFEVSLGEGHWNGLEAIRTENPVTALSTESLSLERSGDTLVAPG